MEGLQNTKRWNPPSLTLPHTHTPPRASSAPSLRLAALPPQHPLVNVNRCSPHYHIPIISHFIQPSRSYRAPRSLSRLVPSWPPLLCLMAYFNGGGGCTRCINSPSNHQPCLMPFVALPCPQNKHSCSQCCSRCDGQSSRDTLAGNFYVCRFHATSPCERPFPPGRFLIWV